MTKLNELAAIFFIIGFGVLFVFSSELSFMGRIGFMLQLIAVGFMVCSK